MAYQLGTVTRDTVLRRRGNNTLVMFTNTLQG